MPTSPSTQPGATPTAQRKSHPTRLPLGVGSSAHWNAMWACMCLPLGAISLGATFVAFCTDPRFAIACLFMAATLLGQGVVNLRAVAAEWPTDVLVDRDGLRIEPADEGQLPAVAFAELDLAACAIVSEEVAERRANRAVASAMYAFLYASSGLGLLKSTFGIPFPEPNGRDVTEPVDKLKLKLRTGEERVIAEAETAEERASLGALLQTLRAADPAAAEPDPPEAPPDLLRCPACGAPVPPDPPVARCLSCGARVPVPRALVERIADQAALAKQSPKLEKLVRALLRQPGATFARRSLKVLLGSQALGWGAALVACAVAGVHESFDLWSLGFAAIGATAICLGLSLALRVSLVDRRALKLLASTFGALPPRGPHEPPRCRNCGAPLSQPPDRAVVHCVFCQVENVLGLDLRPHRRAVGGSVETLSATLASRTRARATWIALALPGLALIALGLASVRWSARHRTVARTLVEGCDQGYAGACSTLAWTYRQPSYFHGRRMALSSDALTLAKRACQLARGGDCAAFGQAKATLDALGVVTLIGKGCNPADDCARAASALGGSSATRDDARALKLYRRGCDLGSGWACNSAGVRLAKGQGAPRDPEAAYDLYLKACDDQFALGCDNAGDMEKDQRGDASDPAFALVLYKDGCVDDPPGACEPLARQYGEDWSKHDEPMRTATAVDRCLADPGDAAACARVAAQFTDGGLFGPNAARRAHYQRRACQLGDARACEAPPP